MKNELAEDLNSQIRQGLFREDLFFRLNVVPLRLPPLRERLEDITDLAQHFFVLAAAEGLPLKRIEPDALERLKRYRWPGNIRELENLTRRLAALYPQEAITAQLVDMELNVDAPDIVPGYTALPNAGNARPAELERRPTLASAMERHLSELFQAHGAGLPPPGLYHRILREIEYPVISAALAEEDKQSHPRRNRGDQGGFASRASGAGAPHYRVSSPRCDSGLSRRGHRLR